MEECFWYYVKQVLISKQRIYYSIYTFMYRINESSTYRAFRVKIYSEVRDGYKLLHPRGGKYA